MAFVAVMKAWLGLFGYQAAIELSPATMERGKNGKDTYQSWQEMQ
jgi:hypothetical protein